MFWLCITTQKIGFFGYITRRRSATSSSFVHVVNYFQLSLPITYLYFQLTKFVVKLAEEEEATEISLTHFLAEPIDTKWGEKVIVVLLAELNFSTLSNISKNLKKSMYYYLFTKFIKVTAVVWLEIEK